MGNDYFKRVHKNTPTRFWINNVTRQEADMALEAGAVGCTQNPSYCWKMLNGSDDAAYAEEKLAAIMHAQQDDTETLMYLQRELVSGIAKRFLPLYESSNGRLGYVSIQGDPFQEDMESIVRFAHFNREAGPNIMPKIPATPEGLKAIEILLAEGIPINATECMAVRQVVDACECYLRATKGMERPPVMCFSLITGIYDEYLHRQVAREGIDIDSDALWQAGMCIAKKVHAIVTDRQYPVQFVGGGARGLHHFTEMVGANANITINWGGSADRLLEMDAPVVPRFLQPVPFWVEEELVEKLEDFRRAYFIHAIEAEEYEDFGPVVLFRNSFEEAWKNALARIRVLRGA